ncbi:DUF4150 domain-containing protein [Pseudenhygromyxa sp. WMMC2535]|uniref:DUF4150 domain-containing protein n=1 Tax=Pseudenhygromyxa sp. WMMC2535 TaxID=2712867 RepID=UPI0015566CB9|nr:DUF4150 domain-containing protein [Pseudenhygromyxa sp. WMMC2535]NVB40823.1 DUF4150 domain-containing protein [Pseudenhygromyxa sp. WMMC2535]
MGKQVFANQMAIVAEAGSGKLLGAFPDVCNSPPTPPAGPVPVPYPNSAYGRDLKQGTKRVKIGGKPAGVKGSHLASSPLGDEAATKGLGGSLLSHTITGKAYFCGHSMNVSFEGQPVVRHLDLMTSNHGSYPGSTPPFALMEEMALEALDDAGGKAASCPCCWSKACAAALPSEIAPGVKREAYGFREYYRLDEVGEDGGLSAVAKARREALAGSPCEGGSCPNAGKAVPKSAPPCDVYRVTTPEEAEAIVGGLSEKTKVRIRIEKGVPGNKKMLARVVMGSPFSTIEDLLKVDGWDLERVRKSVQLDHTTPRAAGGCPSSGQNVEAHALKCKNCKVVDSALDRWSGQELERRRALLKGRA